MKNLDTFNNQLTESQKKFNLRLINSSCERLAFLSEKINLCENKQMFDIYIKFIEYELKTLKNIEEDLINLNER